MRLLTWILFGWLLVAVAAAISAQWHVAHLVPNVALVVVVFAAMRRDAPTVALMALLLGHAVGALALAPLGLHEIALILVGLGTFVVSGNLSATGGLYSAVLAGFADIVYQLLLVVLLVWQGYPVGFSSWATALLLPQAVLTGFAAWFLNGPCERLDHWLTPKKPEGLRWR